MNQTQGIAALRRLFGKNATWRCNEKAVTGDKREELRAALPQLSEASRAAKAARDARRAEILKDPEYVRLCAEAEVAEKANSKAQSALLSRRVTVGRTLGIFFEVKGEGDNWHEAVEKAKAARS